MFLRYGRWVQLLRGAQPINLRTLGGHHGTPADGLESPRAINRHFRGCRGVSAHFTVSGSFRRCLMPMAEPFARARASRVARNEQRATDHFGLSVRLS